MGQGQGQGRGTGRSGGSSQRGRNVAGGGGQCGRGMGGGGAVGLCMPLYNAIAFSKPQPTSEKVGSPKPYPWLNYMPCPVLHRTASDCIALPCSALPLCVGCGGEGGGASFDRGGLKGEEGGGWPAPPHLVFAHQNVSQHFFSFLCRGGGLAPRVGEEGWGGLERERRVWKGWREGLVMRVYKQGSLCTNGGHCVQTGVTVYKQGSLCTSRGHCVQTGVTVYKQGSLCTNGGHCVQTEVTVYKQGSPVTPDRQVPYGHSHVDPPVPYGHPHVDLQVPYGHSHVDPQVPYGHPHVDPQVPYGHSPRRLGAAGGTTKP